MPNSLTFMQKLGFLQSIQIFPSKIRDSIQGRIQELGSNAAKVPNVSQTSMSSGDTTLGSDYTVKYPQKDLRIDAGAFLTWSEANDTSAGKTAQGGKTTASQKSQQLRELILGTVNLPFLKLLTKIAMIHWVPLRCWTRFL
jgi:hypothetical protein